MLQEKSRKKTQGNYGNEETSLDLTDISGEVPEIEETLDEVDKALKKAESLQGEVTQVKERTQRGCGC